MNTLLKILVAVGTLTLSSSLAASSEPTVQSGLRRALDAVTQFQSNGGWGRAYVRDGSLMWGEYLPIPRTWISVQPPATPSVASTFLRAGQVLHEPRYIASAKSARDALLALRTADGGFPYEGDPTAGKATMSTLDDDTTTGALDFLIAWWQYTGKQEDLEAVKSVGDFFLRAQYPCGGWPQRYPPPKDYRRCVTFNDGVMPNVIRALLRVHELTGEARYLESAKKGGEAIIRLQGGPGEAIWAQQYDPDTLQPAWARKMEPPGYSPAESMEVCAVLIDLHLACGEERFLGPLSNAFAWYDTHRLPNGKFARLYEPGTQRPVYGRRDKAEPVYEFEKACTGYGWQGEWFPHKAEEALKRLKAIGREAYVRERKQPEQAPSPERLERSATELCGALSPEGWWLSSAQGEDRAELKRRKLPEDQPIVDMGLFNRNARIVLDYLEAAARLAEPTSTPGSKAAPSQVK